MKVANLAGGIATAAALSAVFIFHQAAPREAPTARRPADWCVEHGVPESECQLCRPPSPGTCEHAMPPSRCPACHPELAERYQAIGDWCSDHAAPESICPRCRAPSRVVRLRSTAVARAAGIGTTVALLGSVEETIVAPARLAFDRTRMFEVDASAAGIVREVRAHGGALVAAQEVLLVIESAETAALQGKLRAARAQVAAAEANLARKNELMRSRISFEREVELARHEVELARSEVLAAEAALRLAGASTDTADGRYFLRAPAAGLVLDSSLVAGRHVSAGEPVLTVADTTTLWALVALREGDAALVSTATRVTLALDGRTLTGRIRALAPAVDPRTRTVEARVELPNPDGALRANMFATATLTLGAPPPSAVIPRDSVQRLGEDAFAFVEAAPAVYEARLVKLGRSRDGKVQVRSGVKPGERVVTTGAFLLKTELSKEAIGAGCCDSVEGPR